MQKLVAMNKGMKDVAETYGAVFLDMEGAFLKNRDRIGWFDNVHYGLIGHKIVAEELFNHLKDNLKQSDLPSKN